MRYVYMDETGTGDINAEPWVIVAGCIVNADKQIKAIESHLRQLVQTRILPKHREGFYFHARDLVSGKGIFSPKFGDYTANECRETVRALCEIPKKFDLKIVVGQVDRKEIAARYPKYSKQRQTAVAQALASSYCAMQVELFMRHVNEDQSEVATLVYELNDHARKSIKIAHDLFKSEQFREIASSIDKRYDKLLPITKVVESPFFQEKADSPLLQVADALAFAVNRKKRNMEFADYFVEPMLDSFVLPSKVVFASQEKTAK